MFGLTFNVGRARVKYQVKAPAVSGHELFERAYRIQLNTIENVLMFLPALWLYALFIGDKGAGGFWGDLADCKNLVCHRISTQSH